VGGLEPYNEISIHSNNLQVVNQINQSHGGRGDVAGVAKLDPLLIQGDVESEVFIENEEEHDQYVSVGILQ
jgi:hypothetical protein